MGEKKQKENKKKKTTMTLIGNKQKLLQWLSGSQWFYFMCCFFFYLRMKWKMSHTYMVLQHHAHISIQINRKFHFIPFAQQKNVRIEDTSIQSDSRFVNKHSTVA